MGEGTPSAAVEFPIEKVTVSAYTVPTDLPESDGTLSWNSTTVVLVYVHAGARQGMGYTYAATAAAAVVRGLLAAVVVGRDAMDVEGCWQAMRHRVRNAGRSGVCSMAIAAVDVALWDLKAKLLELPLARLWGQVRDGVEIYGSGGFTSYDDQQLSDQLAGWVEQGIGQVKMKVGRNPADDPRRVGIARRAIGDDTKLFVDANGAYGRKQALHFAHRFAAEFGVSWFEEPRPSDDLEGLRLLRDRGPAGMEIAAGEYSFELCDVRRLLQAGAIDCQQVDATRCGGFTGFAKAAALCEAFQLPLSAHCAPQLHAHIGCCAQPLRHIEYFHDHVRIAKLFFDGALQPVAGRLTPDLSRPGLGLALKEIDVRKYAANEN
jgi:L-alanine-DL-glutamate epimerase-like enolase superfamily enzyme